MNYINCHSHTDTQTKRTDTKKKTKNKKKRHYKTKELIIKRVKYTHTNELNFGIFQMK
jgi:hypothetical protein